MHWIFTVLLTLLSITESLTNLTMQLNKPNELLLNTNETVKLEFKVEEEMFGSDDSIIIRVMANSNSLFIKFYNSFICNVDPKCMMSMNYDDKQTNKINNGYNTNYIRVNKEKYMNNRQRHQNYTIEIKAEEEGLYQIVVEEKKEGQANNMELIFGSESMVAHLEYQKGMYQSHFYEFYCPNNQQYFEVNVGMDNKYYEKYVRLELFRKDDQEKLLKQEMMGELQFDEKDGEYVAGQMYVVRVDLMNNKEQWDNSIEYQIEVTSFDSLRLINMNRLHHLWIKDNSQLSLKLYIGDYRGSLVIVSEIEDDHDNSYLKYQVGENIFKHSDGQIYEQKEGLTLSAESVEELCREENNECVLYFNVVAGQTRLSNGEEHVIKFRLKILADNYPMELGFNSGINYDYRHIFDFEKKKNSAQIFYMVPKEVKSYMIGLNADLAIDIQYGMIQWNSNIVDDIMRNNKYKYQLKDVSKKYLNIKEQDVTKCYPKCVYVIRISAPDYLEQSILEKEISSNINININLESSKLIAEFNQVYRLKVDESNTGSNQFYIPTVGFHKKEKSVLIQYDYQVGLHLNTKIYYEKEDGKISYMKANKVADGFMVYVEHQELEGVIGIQVMVYSNYRTFVGMKIGLNIGYRILMGELVKAKLEKGSSINYMLLYYNQLAMQEYQNVLENDNIRVHFINGCNTEGLVVGIKKCRDGTISDCDDENEVISNLMARNTEEQYKFEEFHFYLLDFHIADDSETEQLDCEFYLDHYQDDFIRMFSNKVISDSLEPEQSRVFRIVTNRMQYEKVRIETLEGKVSIDRKDMNMKNKYQSSEKTFEYYVDKMNIKEDYVDLEVKCDSVSECVYKIEEMDNQIIRVDMDEIYIQNEGSEMYYVVNHYDGPDEHQIYLQIVSSIDIEPTDLELSLEDLSFIFEENTNRTEPEEIQEEEPVLIHQHQNKYFKYKLDIAKDSISQFRLNIKEFIGQLKLQFSHSEYFEVVQFNEQFYQSGDRSIKLYMEEPLNVRKYHYKLSFWNCLGETDLRYYPSIRQSINHRTNDSTRNELIGQIEESDSHLLNTAELDSETNMILDPMLDDQQGRLFTLDVESKSFSMFRLERIDRNDKYMSEMLEVKAQMDVQSTVSYHYVYIEPIYCSVEDCHKYEFTNVEIEYIVTIGHTHTVQYFGYCQSTTQYSEFVKLLEESTDHHYTDYEDIIDYEEMEKVFKEMKRTKKFKEQESFRIRVDRNYQGKENTYVHVRAILKGIEDKATRKTIDDVIYDYPLHTIFAEDDEEEENKLKEMSFYDRLSFWGEVSIIVMGMVAIAFIVWVLVELISRRNKIITYMRTKALYLEVQELEEEDNILESNDQSVLGY